MRNAAMAMANGWFRSSKRPRTGFRPEINGLETRLALSTASPGVVVGDVTTTDSQSVTFAYTATSPGASIDFGVYRSADAVFDASDHEIAGVAVTPAAVGPHSQTVAIPGGITIEPDRPFVLVVANPSSAANATDTTSRTGSLRMRSVAVITHGGIQYKSDDQTGPLWQQLMADELREQGYDAVIKFVWSSESRSPGRAAEQGPKLARILNRLADADDSTDPISVHFIGHSQGTVVNTRAAQLLRFKQSPNIAAGYLKMTMLDPHAANNSAPGHQYSVNNSFMGKLAKWTIDNFQRAAVDPYASVPRNIDDAEVFWQHTPVEVANTNSGMYNLWGQVPVGGDAKTYDLTGPGISHSGDFGVQNWYRANVVPTLGSGGHFVDPTTLSGAIVASPSDPAISPTSTPTFTGQATPGASVTVLAAASGSYGWKPVGTAVADATTGTWNITTRPLVDGRYRFAARSVVAGFPGRPVPAVTPRLRLGSHTV